MIKSKGDYLAVKVQKGGREFRREGMTIIWDHQEWCGVDLFVQGGFKEFDFEITGVIPHLNVFDILRFCEMFDILPEHSGEWLIIKKL